MIKKYAEKPQDGFTKVKILRGYKDYEIGSIVDIPKNEMPYLLGRKVVVKFTSYEEEKKPIDPEEKKIRDSLQKETQNRAVGLKNSPKKIVKRKPKNKKK